VNWLDAAIIAVIIWFTFAAFQAGFVRESVTIIAAFAGIVVAGLFYQDVGDGLLSFIENETLSRIVAFGVLFGGVALVGQALALVLKPTIDLLQLGIFDQLAGAFFGLAKALVFIQVFLIVFITYPKWNMDETIENSTFGSLIAEKTTVLVKILPDEFDLSLEHFLERL
jgi:uncharacterized membrane protein required for colicin V production